MDFKYTDPNKALTEAEQRIEKCMSDGRRDLNLSRLGLTRFPISLRRFKRLEELDVTNNLLPTLPEWLPELSDLASIDVWSNGAFKIPSTTAT